jgi:flagellar FliL protein
MAANAAVLERPKEEDEAEAGAGEAAVAQPNLVRRIIGKVLGLNKFVLIGGAAAALLAAGGGYFLLGHKSAPVKAAPVAYFYDLPDMTVDLSASPDRPQYLRVKITLESDDKHIADELKPVMPRVIDAFQVHLRELRITDLEGSAGLFRLREELTRRVNLAIAPYRIRAVLFKEIVVQ